RSGYVQRSVAALIEQETVVFLGSICVPSHDLARGKVQVDCHKELNAFMTAARALEEKLLCCLLQFDYFNRKAFPDLDHFLVRLDLFLSEWPDDVPVAVEIRNKHWFTVVSSVTAFLRRTRTTSKTHPLVLYMASRFSALNQAKTRKRLPRRSK